MNHDPLPLSLRSLDEFEAHLVNILSRNPSLDEFEKKAVGILRSPYRSIRRPWVRVTEDDVMPCELCAEIARDGPEARHCEDCHGFREVHGYDDNGLGLPVRRISYD
jgi:hypothetical protein